MADILIGIPTFRRPAMLRRLLDSLRLQAGVDQHRIEVLVADNDPVSGEGSRLAASLEKTYRWPLSNVPVAAAGIAAVRNTLLDAAADRQADYLAMIDDDERAEPRWLAALVEQQETTGADAVAGPVLYEFEIPPSREVRCSGGFPLKLAPSGPVPTIGAGGNLLIACASLARAGQPRFDNGFGLSGGEDAEFFARMKRMGWRFAWANDAIAIETVPPARLSRSSVLQRAYRVGNCEIRIVQRHRDWPRLGWELAKAGAVVATVPFMLPLLLSPSRSLWMKRKWWRAAGKIAAVFGHSYDEYRRGPHAAKERQE